MSPILMTMLMAMVPVVELRGAIPMGVSMDLPVWKVLLASVIGNMIPVPFIVLFVRKVFDWLGKQSGALARRALIWRYSAPDPASPASILTF